MGNSQDKNKNKSKKENKIEKEINIKKNLINSNTIYKREIEKNNKNANRIEEGYYTDHKPIPMNLANKTLKSICKITIKKKQGNIIGTGFFMKIENTKKYLITNYHIISQDIINEDIEIEIYNQKKTKIKLNNHYIKYFPRPKDITIIEINANDIIYDDIELLNYDLNYKNGYEIYENVDIFSIEHPFGESAACASGKIIKIDNYEFAHNIPTKYGSSGCPIILLNNNINIIQVIGIHKEASNIQKLNYGTFIGEIFNEDLNMNIYIIAEFDIKEDFVDKNIRIINSYEEMKRLVHDKIIN